MNLSILMTFPFALGITGGSPYDCFETARYLRAAGARVTLLTVSTVPNAKFPCRRAPAELLGVEREVALRQCGVQVERVEPHPFSPLLDGRAMLRAVRSVLARQRLDAVLGYWHEAAFLPKELRKQNILFGYIGAATYAWTLDYDPGGVLSLVRDLRSRSLYRLARSALYRSLFHTPVQRAYRQYRRQLWLDRPLQQADVIFARSKYTRNEIVKLFGISEQQLEVCHCGVDPRFFEIPRLQRGRIQNLLFFGALHQHKGLPDLLAALGMLANEGQRDWILRVAGSGDQDQIRELAIQHGIAGRVMLLEELDHARLAEQLRWADLAVLPTHAESFGLAIAEAQASGLPVIAGDVGAVPEVVERNDTAWLVPPGDIGALAGAIREALSEPAETYRRGLAGRRRVRALFSWTSSAESILAHLAMLRGRNLRERELQPRAENNRQCVSASVPATSIVAAPVPQVFKYRNS